MEIITNKSTLKGSTIDYYNDLLIKEYKKQNITEFVIFESEKFDKRQIQNVYNNGPVFKRLYLCFSAILTIFFFIKPDYFCILVILSQLG